MERKFNYDIVKRGGRKNKSKLTMITNDHGLHELGSRDSRLPQV